MAILHTIPIRVYYEDTDFSGVVYHANYLRFLERGRTEFLRSLGLHNRALFERGDGPPFNFAVRAMQIEFIVPARMDDVVSVETHVRELRGASAQMAQRILRDGTILLTADVRVAGVSGGRAARFPPDVRQAFESALA